jgi:hypothetical protein
LDTDRHAQHLAPTVIREGHGGAEAAFEPVKLGV